MILRTPLARYLPYPELIEARPHGRPYAIIDTSDKPWLPTNGMTSLVDRKLLVPLRAWARSVVRHESAHVKWSPAEIPTVDYDRRVLLAVEDARINTGLVWTELPVLLLETEQRAVLRLARTDLAERDVHAFVLRAVAALGTNVELPLQDVLLGASAAVRELALRCLARVRGALGLGRSQGSPVPHFDLVERLAAEIARWLEAELERLGYPARPAPALDLAGCCLGHGFGLGAPGGGPAAAPGDRERNGTISGELDLVEAPLDVPYLGAARGRRSRPRAVREGDLARHFHRWPIDSAVFGRRRRRRGGTVLIDSSGSMSLDAAGIDRILAATAGAAQVAVYSGSERRGELRIVARAGRRADAAHLAPYGKGNIVDEPALDWLSHQDEPRLWISDGVVTGLHDQSSPELQERCSSLVQRARIRRVRSLEEAVARLSGSR